MPRPYDRTNRQRQAAETTERIAATTEELLASGPLAGVTLQAIASGAGVTPQTVLRHMNSRAGCLEAVARRVMARVKEQRGGSAPGDFAASISSLMAHYETEGRLMLNLLAQEGGDDAFVQEGARRGRAYHREWVQRCFAPLIGDPTREVVDALVAATDLYVWKLLRLDLRRSAAATEAAITRLVLGVLETP